MSYARQLLDAYPGTVGVDPGVLTAAIDALSDCGQACIADVDADLSEQNVTEMVTCDKPVRRGLVDVRPAVDARSHPNLHITTIGDDSQ